MEIEHLIRFCPLLASFNPGNVSPVIIPERVESLGNFTGLRSIGLRNVGFKETMIRSIERTSLFQTLNRYDSILSLKVWQYDGLHRNLDEKSGV